jgi:cytosine/adenosine deaminase-related metal-dependent hydrolase
MRKTLQTLFPLWHNITPEMQRAASRTAMAELMLSGCTTVAVSNSRSAVADANGCIEGNGYDYLRG